MKHKLLRVLAVATVLAGVSLLALLSISHAATMTIEDVNVFIDSGGGGNNFCGLAGCPSGPAGATDNVIWDFTPPVILETSQSLLLSQTGGFYNFDTSDFCLAAGSCVAAVITVKTTEFGDLVFSELPDRNLTCPAGCGGDTLADPPLETREYSTQASGPPLELKLGYADDAHLQSTHPACATTGAGSDGTGGNPVDCRPNPFSATFEQQASATGGCLGGTDPCYDAGVLRLHNTTRTEVPEPAALFLLGTGLLGLAAWGRRHIRS